MLKPPGPCVFGETAIDEHVFGSPEFEFEVFASLSSYTTPVPSAPEPIITGRIAAPAGSGARLQTMSSSASSVASQGGTEPEQLSRREPAPRPSRRDPLPFTASSDPFSDVVDLRQGEERITSRRDTEEQTVRDFLRENVYNTASTEQSAEQRRQSIMAMDRKRRFTGSTHDGGRRRTNNGNFHDRRPSNHSIHGPLRLDGPSSPHSQSQRRRENSNVPHAPEVIDLTGSSPVTQTRPLPPQPTRTSSTASSQYTVPRWQPDSEVSECPICRRQFSFLFRRHHCRKCGRVVCNDCSPHRITIPRQFIVNPPGPASSRPVSIAQPSETVDLTGDDDDGVALPGFISSMSSNSALGGGEKVRLCNPCVPDPQPNPLPNYSSPVLLSPGEIWRRDQGLPPLDPNRHTLEALPRPQADWERIRDLRRQRGQGMIFQPDAEAGNSVGSTRPRREDGLPPYGNFDFTHLPNDLRRQGRPPSYTHHPNMGSRPSGYDSSTQGVSPAPGSSFLQGSQLSKHDIARQRAALHLQQQYRDQTGAQTDQTQQRHPRGPYDPSSGFHVPARARFPSMDATGGPNFHGSRPRMGSMFDVNARNSMDGSSSSRPLPAGPPRPRLRESDVCPVCRRALPPKEIDGDETARETHIMDCLVSRDSTSSSAPGGRQALMQTPSRAPVQMLPFVATEKDCLGEDGNPQECSICMVEYDVGDQLARLECLCRFHRECIVEWFGRKQECPLHKIA